MCVNQDYYVIQLVDEPVAFCLEKTSSLSLQSNCHSFNNYNQNYRVCVWSWQAEWETLLETNSLPAVITVTSLKRRARNYYSPSNSCFVIGLHVHVPVLKTLYL